MACLLCRNGFVCGLERSRSTTDRLQEQLQELKQQYDTTTRDLQQRIAALEQQIKDDKEKPRAKKQKQNIVSAAELAGEKATRSVLGQSDQVGVFFKANWPPNRPMTS